MVTIGVDARTYFFRSGLGRYCRNMLHALLEQGENCKFVIWLSNQKTVADFPSNSSQAVEIRISQAPFGDLMAERSVLCAEANEAHAHVFFSPYSPIPSEIRMPQVLTVHDLTVYKHPEMHQTSTVRYLKEALPESIGNAAAIVAVSRQTASDLATQFPDAAARVEVVPLGVEDRFYHTIESETISSILARYGLRHKKYLLFLGNIESRKNLPRTVEAYARSSICGSVPLVLAGAARWGSDEVLRKIEELHLEAEVRLLNYVAEEALPAFYQGALFLVYASLYEGFGLPVLEAMASGTAALISDVSSLPEVAGETALYVNPRDIDEIREGIERLASDSSLRERLAADGKIRSLRFTWQRAGRDLLRILMEAAQHKAELCNQR